VRRGVISFEPEVAQWHAYRFDYAPPETCCPVDSAPSPSSPS
jgi:hypothetical protein